MHVNHPQRRSLIPVPMATIKMSRRTNAGSVEKRKCSTLLMGTHNVTAMTESTVEILIEIRNKMEEITYLECSSALLKPESLLG